MRLSAIAAVLASGLAAGASRIETGSAADEDACRITRAASRFQAGDRQVFARVVIDRLKAAGRLTVEWTDPSGDAAERSEYAEFPGGRSVCVLNALQIAGFPPAARSGTWRIQARINGQVAAEQTFEIAGGVDGARIDGVAAHRNGGELRIELSGSGFASDSTVHIARFTSAGGWRYLAAETPVEASGEHLAFRTAALAPGEYIVVIRGAGGAVSRPARLLIPAGEAYRFPAPERERWVVTQRPYGAFSHWNRSRHAWDIAPYGDRRIVAMRPGIARTHDLGMKQTPWKRSFGNYITIDHGDGEYSHYAHLQSGTFLVRDGQRVEQGQPLARAGNSGYALGPGGGVHLHVHVTRSASIAAQSIPFEFGEVRASPAPRTPPALAGTVEAAEWWTGLVTVPRSAAALRVWLEWDSEVADLDLHLVSPSGKHYGWYGDSRGYSGARTRPEEFRIAKPEPGRWRISVQGLTGGPGAIPFRVGVAHGAESD